MTATVTKPTTTKTKTTTTTKPSNPSKTMTPFKSKTPLPPPLLASARGTPFERAVWQLTYQIPAGSFSTYALVAAHLKSSPRAVGNALRRNPFAPEIPWYVVTLHLPCLSPRTRERSHHTPLSSTAPPHTHTHNKKTEPSTNPQKSHRVIATGGTLGGFKGKIGRRDGEGITLAEKRTLLRREGVKLEGDGEKLRVLGTAFRGFV